MPTTATAETLAGLHVSLAQLSGDANPITLRLSVTNSLSTPVCFLSWGSPLDPLALQLGLLTLTPSNSNSNGGKPPFELATLRVSRKLPPSRDGDLITLEPGEKRDNTKDVVLKEPIVPPGLARWLDDGGVVEVVCSGRWTAVWSGRGEDVGDDALAKMDAAEGSTMKGEYESDVLNIRLGEHS